MLLHIHKPWHWQIFSAWLKTPERCCVVLDQPQQAANCRRSRLVTQCCGWSSTQPRSIFRQALRWELFCLAALLLCGCRTVPPLSPVDVSGPGWKVQRGQALWRARSDATEIAGELYLASHADGRSLVQFSKSPIPLIVAQTDTKYWQVKFVPRDKTYDGKLPSTNRLIWPHLSNCLNGSGVPEPWQFERLPDDRWRIENPNTGERLEGYVEPGLPSAHQSEAGDTLDSIARRYGVTVDDLRAANNDLQLEGDQLRAGQTLRIPTPTAP